MKNIAVILSGCGVMDGSEIHESVLTLLALENNGAKYQCFAPNIDQHHVINHLTNEEVPGESRNVLQEAARIARGNIKDVIDANADDFDGLILPGGFGAAKNLCDFAFNGADCTVEPTVAKFIEAMHDAQKPVGLICIAPAMIPRLYPEGTELTIGTDTNVAKSISQMGGKHVDCSVHNIVVDGQQKVVSTPAYMLAQSIKDAATGIDKLVAQVLSLS